jgi:hypothetical protein
MTRAAVMALVLVGVLASPGPVGDYVNAQQPACLHGAQETPEQAARKRAALTFTRQVNTLQLKAGATGAYLLADQIQIPVPEGFEFRLAAAPKSYAFSLRDNTDPCRFAFFSDQQGLIFQGEVIR